ncbi:phage NrS-1 polymerase family protein [Halosimplex amylolyticum]|uniref:phage NrS-1 polymerase family protein n=1 Tax=Halosimplex amylolyticum TaxID=3396616 RepID=UPI003F54A2AC
MDDTLLTASTLPDELVTRDQWVCWRNQERNGTETKVPINPHTGAFASVTDSETWASFETACESVESQTVDGIGFVFTETDPLVGVDLDECRIPETETITDDATDIVDRLTSYTEVSPSGTGVHVICTGTLPGDRSRKGWVELYEEARFFTVTGDHIESTPTTVESRTSELATVHTEYVASASTTTETDDSQPESGDPPTESTADAQPEASGNTDSEAGNGLTDSEVVDRAQSAANGEKFTRLWNGDTGGYESHSEADMALCALLAFWTGGASGQIDRLFRESGLMREKWNEQHYADGSTYGEKTIDRVLQGTDEFYQPPSDSPEGNSTDDGVTDGDSAAGAADQSTATEPSKNDAESEDYALHEQLSELRTREERHLTVIATLQSQVERLETENERLAEEVSTVREEASASTDDRSGLSVRARLRRWLPFGPST